MELDMLRQHQNLKQKNNMLPKEQIVTLAENSGIDADVLAKAISDEQEVKIELPKGVFLTEDKKAALLDNHGKTRYDAGVSKATKDAFDGKSKDEFLNEFKTSIIEDAKIEPNKKVEDLQNSLAQLQNKYQEDIGTKDQLIKDKELKLNSIERKGKLQAASPKLNEGMSFNDAFALFTISHERKEDGIYKDGVLLKNDVQAPLSEEDAYLSFVKDRGWIAEDPKGNGGKGKGNATNTPKTYDQFKEVCKSKGWSEGSQEAREYLRSIKAKDPNFQI